MSIEWSVCGALCRPDLRLLSLFEEGEVPGLCAISILRSIPGEDGNIPAFSCHENPFPQKKKWFVLIDLPNHTSTLEQWPLQKILYLMKE